MTKITQHDSARFWQGVRRTAEQVSNWPAWKQHPTPASIVLRDVPSNSTTTPVAGQDPKGRKPGN